MSWRSRSVSWRPGLVVEDATQTAHTLTLTVVDGPPRNYPFRADRLREKGPC
jgi:hypothetical protein